MPAQDPVRVAKPIVLAIGLAPFVWLAWAFLIVLETLPPNTIIGDLGANPVEYVRNFTGEWTLRFLVLTLAMTPVRQITGWNGAIRFRRMFGLLAFFYSAVHFITYLGLDVVFDMEVLWKDVAKRPFITAGFISFVLMLPLALTSTKGWIRRLGGHRWQQLHWLVYPSAIAGVVHYYWKVKLDIRYPVMYAVAFGLLLGYRVVRKLMKRGSSGARAAAG
ncbi:MAG TPA: protein-methionine-sulfoxide reductase heme-binding subunit MsrQ [Terriglobia bacterium]|nr:protein-methionine-sulfoxide reductase heme-binding subunit MsrQ [Terriglobia bacterium]